MNLFDQQEFANGTNKTGQVRSSFRRSVFSKCEKPEPTDSSVEFQGAFNGVSGIGQMKFFTMIKDKRQFSKANGFF